MRSWPVVAALAAAAHAGEWTSMPSLADNRAGTRVAFSGACACYLTCERPATHTRM